MKEVFRNCTIITQNSKRKVFRNGMIVIENNQIVYVGPQIEYKGNYIDLKGNIVIPGFINVHTHLQASTLKGSLYDVDLKYYLLCNERIREKQSKAKRKHYSDVAIEAGLLESIQNGTTTLCSSSCAELAEKYGIRVYTGPLLMNVARLHEDYQKFKTHRLNLNFQEEKNRPMLFVHSLYRLEISMLKKIRDFMNRHSECLLSIHVSETQEENAYVYRHTGGKTPIELLHSYGLITPSTLLVHCTYVNERDLEIISKCGAKIVVCPVSNINIGEKIPNIPLFCKMGIKFCLGTDGMATGGSYDLLENVRITYYIVMQQYGFRLSPQKLLDLITVEAADVVNNKMIGSLESGKNADMVILDNGNLELHPIENVVQNIVFANSSKSFMDVFVDGIPILRNGEFGFEMNTIIDEYDKVGLELKNNIKECDK